MVSKKNIIILLLLLIADQITKAIVAIAHPSIDLKILAFSFVKNTGAIWGLFQNSNMIFIWMSIIAIGILIYIYDQIPKKAIIFYVLVFAGIIGNLIDRIFRGFVVDFIDFKFWPVFNFADSYLVIGIIGLIWFLLKEDKKK